MKLWALVGEGPNDVMIPALIFMSEEDALKRCREIFGAEPKIYKDEKTYRWLANDEDEFEQEIVDQVYTSYYGGCGEFYAATLMEIETGKPFVCFNLD